MAALHIIHQRTLNGGVNRVSRLSTGIAGVYQADSSSILLGGTQAPLTRNFEPIKPGSSLVSWSGAAPVGRYRTRPGPDTATGVDKDSCQKLMDLRMNDKSVCSCHRLFTKLQVSKRPKGTDLSLNLQGVT